LIEGGASTIGRALKEKSVNQMHIYIAPTVLGDESALSSVRGLKVRKIRNAIRLKNIKIKKIQQDIMVIGDV